MNLSEANRTVRRDLPDPVELEAVAERLSELAEQAERAGIATRDTGGMVQSDNDPDEREVGSQRQNLGQALIKQSRQASKHATELARQVRRISDVTK